MALSAEALERIHSRLGTVVGRKYHLDELLGVGGTAAVYSATHRNGNRVALKVLHPELGCHEQVRARFLREGYVANRVGHSGVVRVIDDEDDERGTVFLVLELLSGETLDRRAARSGGTLPLRETLDHLDHLLDVLVAAHGEGIVHRDIKPENLFFTAAGELKVLDFGVARLLDGTGATQTGQVIGTPAFMSPEQAGGLVRHVDARSDVWSTGAVAFNLCTGAAIHSGRTVAERMVYAATQPVRPVHTLAPELPLTLAHALDKAMAFDRDKRWDTARAMQVALRGVSLSPSPA